MRLAKRKNDRTGAAAVEFAFVAIPFFLVVFGVLEFGRLVLVQHLLTNAANHAARMAALNTDVNDNDENHLTAADIEAVISPLLSGVGIRDHEVHIYHVEDPNTDWATDATLQHRIAVDVEGNYQPMTPVFSLLGGTGGLIPVSARSYACSEGH